MDGWMIGIIAAGLVLLCLRLWAGPGRRKPRARKAEVAPADEPDELWTVEALARLGTETSVADLTAQGRADELRGLGFQGDIPGQDAPR